MRRIPCPLYDAVSPPRQMKEGSAEAALEKLQAFYSACKAIEQRLSQRRSRLKAKIPDIESTYNALLQMQAQVSAPSPTRVLMLGMDRLLLRAGGGSEARTTHYGRGGGQRNGQGSQEGRTAPIANLI